MKKVYLITLALLCASFAFSQKVQKTHLTNGATYKHAKSTENTQLRTVNASFYEDFEDGFPTDWTIIDNDADGNAWHSNAGYNNTPAAHAGDSCATVLYNSTGNDDWLITPAITIADGDELSFYAASTSDWLESFNVKVSTTTNEMTSFTIELDAQTDIANEYTKYSYILTDNAEINADDVIYIAIQCVSVDANVLRLDNFRVDAPIVDPIAELSHTDVNLGYVNVGEPLETIDLTLTNTGAGSLTVSSITDLSATDFSTSFDASAVSLAGDESYAFTFTYTPATADADAETFEIETNAGTLTINLAGHGSLAPEGDILVDNTEITPAGYFASTELGGQTPGDVTLADDFELPEGTTWNISTVVTKGTRASDVAIDHFVVKIFSDDNNAPGTEIFSENITSNQNNDEYDQTLVLENPFTIDEAGKYWINVYAHYATGNDLNTTLWGALGGSAELGSSLMIKDTPDLLGGGLTTWTVLQPYSQASLASLYFQIYGEITTKIETKKNSDINIYPNPTKGLVKISETGNVEVYNMLGQVVMTKNNSSILDLTSFENGTYIVKVTTDSKTLTKKVNLIK
jgi:hypothetical protein